MRPDHRAGRTAFGDQADDAVARVAAEAEPRAGAIFGAELALRLIHDGLFLHDAGLKRAVGGGFLGTLSYYALLWLEGKRIGADACNAHVSALRKLRDPIGRTRVCQLRYPVSLFHPGADCRTGRARTADARAFCRSGDPDLVFAGAVRPA